MVTVIVVIILLLVLVITFLYLVHKTQRDLEDAQKSALENLRRDLNSKERLLDLKTRIMDDKISVLRKSNDNLRRLVMRGLETGQVDKDDEELQEFIEKLKTLGEYINNVDSEELKGIIERVYSSKPNKRT